MFSKNTPNFQFTYQPGLVMRVPPLHCGDQLEKLGLLHLTAAASVVDLETWIIHFHNLFFVIFLSLSSPILSS